MFHGGGQTRGAHHSNTDSNWRPLETSPIPLVGSLVGPHLLPHASLQLAEASLPLLPALSSPPSSELWGESQDIWAEETHPLPPAHSPSKRPSKQRQLYAHEKFQWGENVFDPRCKSSTDVELGGWAANQRERREERGQGAGHPSNVAPGGSPGRETTEEEGPRGAWLGDLQCRTFHLIWFLFCLRPWPTPPSTNLPCRSALPNWPVWVMLRGAEERDCVLGKTERRQQLQEA